MKKKDFYIKFLQKLLRNKVIAKSTYVRKYISWLRQSSVVFLRDPFMTFFRATWKDYMVGSQVVALFLYLDYVN